MEIGENKLFVGSIFIYDLLSLHIQLLFEYLNK